MSSAAEVLVHERRDTPYKSPNNSKITLTLKHLFPHFSAQLQRITLGLSYGPTTIGCNTTHDWLKFFSFLLPTLVHRIGVITNQSAQY